MYTLKDGREIIVRNIEISDARNLIEYVKIVITESNNLSMESNEFNLTVEQEEKIIASWKESKLANALLASIDGRIIANCTMSGREGKSKLSHRVSLGISVLKEFWGQGIGYTLMQDQIKYAKENGIKKIDLEVKTDNASAIHLYKKCGFVIEGTHKHALLINDQLVDNYYMGLIME